MRGDGGRHENEGRRWEEDLAGFGEGGGGVDGGGEREERNDDGEGIEDTTTMSLALSADHREAKVQLRLLFMLIESHVSGVDTMKIVFIYLFSQWLIYICCMCRII